jgi:cell division septum initiation protein DivIVA
MKMAENSSFLKWVGFKGDESDAPSSLDRIRELEAQIADLKSRRDITGLSKEEFEILATETAMSMIKSAQARENSAQTISTRLIADANRVSKEELEAADSKARAILNSAETRAKKHLQSAESEAEEKLAEAEAEAEALLENKRREATTLTTVARREGERIVSEATSEVSDYRQWLTGVIGEAERLYKIQTQSLDAAETAIRQSRARLESAFTRLSDLQRNVIENLNSDDTIINTGPIRVTSERTKPALAAPRKSNAKKSTSRK